MPAMITLLAIVGGLGLMTFAACLAAIIYFDGWSKRRQAAIPTSTDSPQT